MSRRHPLPPERHRDLRGFYLLRDGTGNIVFEGARFSDGALVTRHVLTGQTYPHATIGDAQRVHVGMTFEKVR